HCWLLTDMLTSISGCRGAAPLHNSGALLLLN
ncbi:hypothetical protein ACUXKK_005184, partial [Klebsiella aerogenes]